MTSVAFSPDGRLLAAASQDDKVWLWRITGPGGAGTTAGTAAAGTKSARRRAARGPSASPDGTLTGATDWVSSVAFSPDSEQLAAGSSDASVLVWNVATRSLTTTLPQPQPVTSLDWDGQGHLIPSNDTEKLCTRTCDTVTS